MKRFLISLAGIFALFLGVFFFYSFLNSLSTGNNILELILFFITMSGGIFCIIKAARIAETSQTNKTSITSENGFQQMLDKNNALEKDWNNTLDKRDKLKMLEVAGDAEEQKH